MPAPTTSDLIVRYPEFTGAPSGLQDAALAEAILQMDEGLWGTLYEVGTLALTAHLLAVNPQAKLAAACCDSDGMTQYYRYWLRLAKMVTAGRARIVSRDIDVTPLCSED